MYMAKEISSTSTNYGKGIFEDTAVRGFMTIELRFLQERKPNGLPSTFNLLGFLFIVQRTVQACTTYTCTSTRTVVTLKFFSRITHVSRTVLAVDLSLSYVTFYRIYSSKRYLGQSCPEVSQTRKVDINISTRV